MTLSHTRRQWLEGALALFTLGVTSCAKGAGLSNRRQGKAPGAPASKALVARARRSDVMRAGSNDIDMKQLEDMLGRAVAHATGDASPSSAFKRLFRASDVVGIKVGTLAGPGLSPHPQLVDLLVRWLVAAGVSEQSIVIFDRLDNELERAGFRINRTSRGPRCVGTNQDYDWTPREWGAGASCFAGLLVNELTALINVGVLKDHDLAGVSAGMKNWYGVIHNPNKYHDDGCNPYVAHLAASPIIRGKLRLTVIDALVAQCHGGPARSPRWAWPLNSVLVSTDPVALDTTCWQMIEAQRKIRGLKTLTEEQRAPQWIASAGQLGLGEHRTDRIRVVDV